METFRWVTRMPHLEASFKPRRIQRAEKRRKNFESCKASLIRTDPSSCSPEWGERSSGAEWAEWHQCLSRDSETSPLRLAVQTEKKLRLRNVTYFVVFFYW